MPPPITTAILMTRWVRLHKVAVKALGLVLEVTDDGRIDLPSGLYSPADLRKIAREVNRAFRESRYDSEVEDEFEPE